MAATEGVQHDARRAQEIAEAEHQVKMAQLGAQRQAEQAAPEQAKRDAKVAEATRLFDEVRARKRERMAMEAEREQARLDAVSAGSDKMIETLSRIAETSDDPQVAMELYASWPNCVRRTWTPRRTPTETTKLQRTVHILRLTWRVARTLASLHRRLEQRKRRSHC